MSLFKSWDGKDVSGEVALIALATGSLAFVKDHKTKKLDSDKEIRVSKKIPNGIYELGYEGLLNAELHPRHVLKRGDLYSIFPHIDSRNLIGTKKDGIDAKNILAVLGVLLENKYTGILIKHQEGDQLEFIAVSEKHLETKDE